MINKNNVPSYPWGDQCESFVLLDSDTLSVKQETMPPGTSEVSHFHHRARQFFYILKGIATFQLNEKYQQLGCNEAIHVKAGIAHAIANKGIETLEFLVISEPSTEDDRVNLE